MLVASLLNACIRPGSSAVSFQTRCSLGLQELRLLRLMPRQRADPYPECKQDNGSLLWDHGPSILSLYSDSARGCSRQKRQVQKSTKFMASPTEGLKIPLDLIRISVFLQTNPHRASNRHILTLLLIFKVSLLSLLRD